MTAKKKAKRKTKRKTTKKTRPDTSTAAEFMDGGDDTPPHIIPGSESITDAPQPVAKAKKTHTVSTELRAQHFEWLKRSAHFEGMRRKEKISLARMLEIIVREAYAADPTKAGAIASGTTGKAGDFNAEGGDWQG